MTACPSPETLLSQLDGAEPAAPHLEACPGCRERLEWFSAIRRRARPMGPAAWGPLDGDLDLEGALARVEERSRRPSRVRRLYWVTSAAAAALLVSALGLSYALRLRVDRPAAFRLPPSAARRGLQPSGVSTVFWTAAPARSDPR